MRASRLLTILLLLQNRGRLSAAALAAELEVSPRTVYRDVDALSAAGIPIASERGPHGGFHLVDGYRTRLTGLSEQEAAALVFAGMPEPAAELGLGLVLASAQLKLLASMPADIRERAARVRERFHLDAPGWFQDTDETPYLTAVAKAVWDQESLRVRYRRWAGEVELGLNPLGVVLKAGHWYVVAHIAETNEPRTLRVSRVLELDALGERFERPAAFDLTAYWHSWSHQFEAGLYQTEARIRLSARAWQLAPRAFDPIPAQAVLATAGAPDGRGWREAVLPIEGIDHAMMTLLRFGAEIEVLAPPRLRQEMRQTAAALAEMYRVGPEAPPRPAAAGGTTAAASEPMPALASQANRDDSK